MSVDTGHLMTTKNTKERQVECALFLNKHHPVLALRRIAATVTISMKGSESALPFSRIHSRMWASIDSDPVRCIEEVRTGTNELKPVIAVRPEANVATLPV